jgi:hypothetical protein
VGAIRSAIDGDFASRAATDGADGFALGGTEARPFSLFTNRASHRGLQRAGSKKAGYAALQGNKIGAEVIAMAGLLSQASVVEGDELPDSPGRLRGRERGLRSRRVIYEQESA